MNKYVCTVICFSQDERDRIDKVIEDYIEDYKNENCQE